MNKPVKNNFLYIQICSGQVICVPNDINLLTPYVLLEQEDWFEDEIKFIRRYLQPGMNVIDIGANYGVYTLSAAAAVGPTGRVQAFEPSSTTASYLQQSISVNQLNNVQVIQKGVSDNCGTAQLRLNDNSEMNAISSCTDPRCSYEQIDLTSLDDWNDRHGLSDIDLLKIDAEGHEKVILKGGTSFFAAQSPLVMFEIKEGQTWHLELLDLFKSIGYSSYRLVPGLNILIPFDSQQQPDSFLYNLFCCKQDRAEVMEKQGLLSHFCPNDAVYCVESQHSGLLEFLTGFPYSGRFLGQWEEMTESSQSSDREIYLHALECYACAREPWRSDSEKVIFLWKAHHSLADTLATNQTLSRMFTFIRIAMDLGHRSEAGKVILEILHKLNNKTRLVLDEPFLSISPRLESIDPGSNFDDWVISSVLEQLILVCSFSTYYTGTEALPYLEYLKTMAFQSPDMERRRQLVRLKAGLQEKPEDSRVFQRTPGQEDYYNRSFWACN